MVAKLRNCCRIAAPVDGSAAWTTSEEPARMATPRAAQNGTVQRVSRRSTGDVISGSHDSTAYDGRREARCTARAPRDVGARGRARDADFLARESLRLGRAPALPAAAPAHVVQRRRSPAGRRGLAVRAQVGWLSHAGVSGRGRDLAAEP